MKKTVEKNNEWLCAVMDEARYWAAEALLCQMDIVERALAGSVEPSPEMVRAEFIRIANAFGMTRREAATSFEKMSVWA